jgi:hypothetical protein
MRKLRMEIGDLHVESFEAVTDLARRGTVEARELTEATCNQFTCGQTCDPNDFSCNGQVTCYGPRCPASQYPTCDPVCHTGDIC